MHFWGGRRRQAEIRPPPPPVVTPETESPGIVAGHVYGVQQVKEVGGGQMFVQLRNPWFTDTDAPRVYKAGKKQVQTRAREPKIGIC